MNFLSIDPINVTRLVLAIRVEKGTPEHRNRPSHGLALRRSGDAVYRFEESGRSFHVRANDLIYLPKGSSYTVAQHILGETYAINFDVEGDALFAPFLLSLHNPVPVFEAFKAAVAAWEGRRVGGTQSAVRTCTPFLLTYKKSANVPICRRRVLHWRSEPSNILPCIIPIPICAFRKWQSFAG